MFAKKMHGHNTIHGFG